MLDSKNIYIAASANARKVSWRHEQADTEWQYVGTSEEIDEKILQARIEGLFVENSLFLVIDRHRSRNIERGSAAEEVIRELRNSDVMLCNHEFEHFLEFNQIGVVREGRRASAQERAG
jgi:hypothetical protein